jgi:uncharacterized repeat protein (TIGR03803 family)
MALPVFLLVFCSGPLPAQQWVILHDFSADAEPNEPDTTLVEVSPGVFVGSYMEGLFKISSSGAFSVLSSFSDSEYSIAGEGPLAPASNGYLYGVVTASGGASDVYSITPSGRKSLINSSLSLVGPLMEGSDGNLWGAQGSVSTGVSVFKMSLAGAATTVAGPVGGLTLGPLLQASDGNFYGATYPSSATTAGIVYRVTPSGQYTVLYTFPAGNGSEGGLMQATNEWLYGTWVDSMAECPNPGGGVFAISLSGRYQSILQFPGCDLQGSIGPGAGLIEASNGLLYGSLQQLGTFNYGSIFSLSLDGSSFQKIAEFNFSDGADPASWGPALTQGSDGSLYGTTVGGGSQGGGTVFQLNLGLTPPLPSVRLLQPSSGAPGATVRLTGNYLLGLTAVTFNGTPAAFTAINVNYADAVVPPGATTGPITVTTMNGSAATTTSFTVQ